VSLRRGGSPRWWRIQLNRAVVAAGLAVTLPLIALAERARPGAGRRVAVSSIRVISRLCGVRFEVVGRERLEPGRGYVVVPNHSSPLDIPAVLLVWPDARFLAAVELFRLPLLGSAMRALGALPVDRRRPLAARRQIDEAAAMGGDRCLVIFPEGGIPAPGTRRQFKTGAFVAAITAGVPVLPVAIHATQDLLGPGSLLALRPGTVTVELLDPVATDGMTVADRRVVRDQAEQVVVAALKADAA
jgi:1-acyl-sn-glycerol-3-phosphate acyltransferase